MENLPTHYAVVETEGVIEVEATPVVRVTKVFVFFARGTRSTCYSTRMDRDRLCPTPQQALRQYIDRMMKSFSWHSEQAEHSRFNARLAEKQLDALRCSPPSSPSS